jgi:hypothetical protein
MPSPNAKSLALRAFSGFNQIQHLVVAMAAAW